MPSFYGIEISAENGGAEEELIGITQRKSQENSAKSVKNT
jgi:hypothetical protein